jgi:CDP-glycerol glycerophosphotransferase (TagB/SpsB family)
MSHPRGDAWEAEALRRIRGLHAEVVLYFSGLPESTYQVNMWLETLERLPYRTVVLLRERHVLDGLAPTHLPVVCMPSGVSVMQAGLSSARVALYPANTSKNLHLLREPGMKHVFIGHGDSDKVSSINPFTRVYDQVWVAGRAGRDRWARAAVGVRDENIVEVGRPQLDGIRRGASGGGDRMTVLYAPTWEGWNDETFFSSITTMGPRLVRALLELQPDVRIIYKPHPLTGRRDRRAARSHEQIVDMLATSRVSTAHPPADQQLEELADRLDRDDLSLEDRRTAADAWSNRFWEVVGDSTHVLVESTRPTLYDCFNRADLLVADVSSVVSDFMASGKPYVCADPQGLPEADFRARNPSARGAYILTPDCRDVAAIIDLVRGADPLAPQRDKLREYLLGPDQPPPLDRWSAAIAALVQGAGDGRTTRPLAVDESVLEEVDAGEQAPVTDAPRL